MARGYWRCHRPSSWMQCRKASLPSRFPGGWPRSPSEFIKDFEQDFQRMQNEMRRFERDFVGSSFFDRWLPRPRHRADESSFFENELAQHDVVQADGKKTLQLHFDTRNFKPEEIKVKAYGNTLKVHAKHEEKSDTGAVYREFSREYTLPEGIDLNALKSVVSHGGILKIEAPYVTLEPPKETEIPIERESKPEEGKE